MPARLLLFLACVCTASAFAQTTLDQTAALSPFHNALTHSDRRPIRVMVYGASHTASDEFTSALRASLQARYGDGGLGWVLPTQPFPYYGREDANLSGRGFEGRFVRFQQRTRGDFGLAGFALESGGPAHARIRLVRSLIGQRLQVSYLQQPGGGSFEVRVGGQTRALSTDGPRSTITTELVASLPETRSVGVQTTDDGPVRLFGFAAEHPSGVVVDAFGVPGTNARDQLRWNEESLADALRARPPDLVVLAYGTNESSRRHFDSDRDDLRAVIRRFKNHAPRAACLLMGPGDWPRHIRGEWRPRPRITQVIREQREVARELGCAHFNTFEVMGGEGSMVRWVRDGLGLSDHVHWTQEGHARIARELLRTLAENDE